MSMTTVSTFCALAAVGSGQQLAADRAINACPLSPAAISEPGSGTSTQSAAQALLGATPGRTYVAHHTV
jgi:hypothetical protein